MHTVDKKIGIRLKEYRKNAGMTQSQVADGIGISSDYYGRIERGALIPTFKVLASIKKNYDWDMDYILTGMPALDSPFYNLFENCSEENRNDLTEAIIWIVRNNIKMFYEQHQEYNMIIELAACGRELANSRVYSLYEAFSKLVKENEQSINVKHTSNQLFDSNVVYHLRESMQKNKNVMADYMGMGRRRYHNIEKGKSYPDLSMIQRLAIEYRVNPNYLMTGRIEDMSELTLMWNHWNAKVQKRAMEMIEQMVRYINFKK